MCVLNSCDTVASRHDQRDLRWCTLADEWATEPRLLPEPHCPLTCQPVMAARYRGSRQIRRKVLFRVLRTFRAGWNRSLHLMWIPQGGACQAHRRALSAKFAQISPGQALPTRAWDPFGGTCAAVVHAFGGGWQPFSLAKDAAAIW